MSIHDEVRELIPGYALDALDPAEAASVRAHLAGCASCNRILEEYRSVAAQIALAVPQVEPARALKAKTMQRALKESPREVYAEQVLPKQPRWHNLGWANAFAALAVVIALVILLWNVWQTAQLSQQLALQRDFTTVLAYAQGSALDIHGTDAAPEADGKFYVDAEANVAALVTVDLPPLTPGRVYQAWLVESAGQRVSGGTFMVDDSGSGWLLVRAPRPIGEYAQVEVTIEPEGGAAVQTTRPVLAAKLRLP